MKLEQEIRWVNETDINQPLEIVDFQIKEKDKILILRHDLELVQMSVWGKNFNYLYNMLGADSDDWLEHTILLKQEVNAKGKFIRTIYGAK